MAVMLTAAQLNTILTNLPPIGIIFVPNAITATEEHIFIQKQADLEEQVAQAEVEVESNEHIKIDSLEIKLQSLQEELDGIKVLNALIAEQIEKELLEEEEIIFLLLAA